MASPTEQELRERVRETVAAIAPIKQVAIEPSTRFVEDLGYDSLGLVELVLTLEAELELPEVGEEAAGLGIEDVAGLEDLVVATLMQVERPVS